MQGNITVGADVLLTVKEAARRLKVSTATVYALCETGRLPYVRISTHSIRVAENDLAAYVRSTRVRSGPAWQPASGRIAQVAQACASSSARKPAGLTIRRPA
jgi:excisionase family DNA binding protein